MKTTINKNRRNPMADLSDQLAKKIAHHILTGQGYLAKQAGNYLNRLNINSKKWLFGILGIICSICLLTGLTTQLEVVNYPKQASCNPHIGLASGLLPSPPPKPISKQDSITNKH